MAGAEHFPSGILRELVSVFPKSRTLPLKVEHPRGNRRLAIANSPFWLLGIVQVAAQAGINVTMVDMSEDVLKKSKVRKANL